MTTISLKQWITTTFQSTDHQLSSAYITAALQIAIHLSEQIVDAEVSSGIGGLASHSLPPSFPTSCVDWTECVSVLLNEEEEGETTVLRDSLGGLALSAQSDVSVEELLDLIARAGDNGGVAGDLNDFDASAGDFADRSNNRINEGEDAAGDDAMGRGSDYFNVEGTKLVYDSPSGNQGIQREKVQRIYSLGLVFYQLFSGGELPPPELLVVSTSSGELTNISASSGPSGGEESGLGQSGLSALDDLEESFNVSINRDAYRRASLDSTDSSKEHHVAEYGCRFGSLGGSKRNHCESLRTGDGGRASVNSCSDGHSYLGSSKRQSVSSRSLGHSTASSGIVRCDEPIDSLRTKGVPASLCDLIYNMIDSINRNLPRSDSYTEMYDVTCDLQLMLEQPATFLDPLDVDKLMATGLELGETLFVREEELTALQCAYQRSMSGSPEVAIVSGVSGTGKTTVANRFSEYVTDNGGIFLSGKFDQMTINASSPVISAFDSYCDLLASQQGTDRTIQVVSELEFTLGQDVHYLAQVIPNLRRILPEGSSSESFSNQDCVDAQQRLNFLLYRFVEVICNCSEGPIVLFVDDNQWSDPASISIMSHLLKASRSIQNEKFFFLGSCRDDEMPANHPFWNMIKSVEKIGFAATHVKLECMSKDTVNQVLSKLLHVLPRLVRSLANTVYHKTKGNPLFVSRMLQSLNREGLMRISLNRHEWEWDEEKIQSRKIPDDVAQFFVESINSLPIDVKMALGTLSCFGNSTHCEIISAIETDLDLNLVEPLNDSIAEGLLDIVDGKYYFCHDKIQEACYSMIDSQDVCLHHMNYGLSLINHSYSSRNIVSYFTAVMQLNLGGPKAVQCKEQFSLIAKYNLIAGEKAMDMADFTSAFQFLDHGISFLPKKHWQNEYDLSLKLYNLAAKCALAIKDVTSLTILCDAVAKNARCPDDALNTNFTTMLALAHTKLSDSIDYGFNLLTRLGVDLPTSSSREDVLNQIHQTQSMLSNITDETLLSYHVTTDYKRVMATKVLAKMIGSLNQCKPSLVPLVIIKLVRITIEHGLTPMSAIGFAYFGGMIADLGDLRGGVRYTKLAKALLDKHQSNEIKGEVFWVTSDTLSYMEPLQVIYTYRHEGQRMAMGAGDIHCACMNKLLMVCDQMWSGTLLSEMENNITKVLQFSEEHGHLTSVNYIKIFDTTVKRLKGGSENQAADDNQLAQTSIQNKNPYELQIFIFHKMFLSLVMNNYDDMKQNAEIFFSLEMPSWYLQAGYAVHAFIGGLVSYRIYRETRDPMWAERGRKFKERIQVWNQQGSSWNFEHKSYLIEAEESYSNGNYENARILYAKAVSSAQQHKFIHEEALAHELQANFYLALGDKLAALQCFTTAHEKYFEWKAFLKVKALYAFIQEMFHNILPGENIPASGNNNIVQSPLM